MPNGAVGWRGGLRSLFAPLRLQEQGKWFQHVCMGGLKNGGVVPCNERVCFNNMTGEEVTFVANQRTYIVKCHKGRM